MTISAKAANIALKGLALVGNAVASFSQLLLFRQLSLVLIIIFIELTMQKMLLKSLILL